MSKHVVEYAVGRDRYIVEPMESGSFPAVLAECKGKVVADTQHMGIGDKRDPYKDNITMITFTDGTGLVIYYDHGSPDLSELTPGDEATIGFYRLTARR